MTCDADGVIVDWFGPLVQFINYKIGTAVGYDEISDYNFTKFWGVPESTIHDIVTEFNTSLAIEKLLPIDGAIQTLQRLQSQFEFAIITSRFDCYREGTLQWFSHYHPTATVHFSDGANNPFAGGDGRKTKENIAEELGAICLIEDNPHEFENWSSSQVLPICFQQPWNADVTTVPRMNWPGIERFLTFLARFRC